MKITLNVRNIDVLPVLEFLKSTGAIEYIAVEGDKFPLPGIEHQEDMDEIDDHLDNGDLILAVKHYRNATRSSLLTAKDEVTRYRNERRHS